MDGGIISQPVPGLDDKIVIAATVVVALIAVGMLVGLVVHMIVGYRKDQVEVLPPPCPTVERDPYSLRFARMAKLFREWY